MLEEGGIPVIPPLFLGSRDMFANSDSLGVSNVLHHSSDKLYG